MIACYIKLMEPDRIQSLAGEFGMILIYLFGSRSDEGEKYLQGVESTQASPSDLDIAVFFDNPPADRMEVYGRLYRSFSQIFDPFNIDLVFMDEVDTLFRFEIIKGVRIYAKDEDFADIFEESIMKKAGDLLFKKRMMNKEIMEAVENGYFEFEYRPGS